MSDGEDRGERKRKNKKNKHKKEKKSRRDRSHESEKEEKEEAIVRECTSPVEDAPQPETSVVVQVPTAPPLSIPPAVSNTTTVETPPTDPSTSNEKKEDEDDDMKIDPWIPFDCSVCKLNAKCYYRELRCSDGFYSSPVFFMRDPFTAPPRVRGRKPVLNDYVVIGALCEICSQPSCFAKSCTLYFGAHFCSSCVGRERRRFPEKLVEGVAKARSALSAYVDPAMKTEEKEEKIDEKK